MHKRILIGFALLGVVLAGGCSTPKPKPTPAAVSAPITP